MSTTTPKPIEVWTQFRLINPDATSQPIGVRLFYDPSDPYAFTFGFEYRRDEEKVWAVAREVVLAGLETAAGVGDVRVWPWMSPRGAFVAIAISSPDGSALFEAHRLSLVSFLRRTYVVVPRGRESEFLDVDGAVGRMLAEAGGSL